MTSTSEFWGSSLVKMGLIISGSGLLTGSTTGGGTISPAAGFVGSLTVVEGFVPRSLASSFFSSDELIGG